MRRQLRTFGIVVAATLLLAGCGDGNNPDNGNENDNTNARTPTPVVTSTPAATLPGATATELATPQETETPVATGPTSTPVGPTSVVTATPVSATATRTPTPVPTATAAAAFCGNGTKDAGEDCDTGTDFAVSNADCATQCACCLCRPAFHAAPGPKCSTCHPSIAPALTFPAGAAETFPGLCE